MMIISNGSASVASTMKPAGLDNSQGVISSAYFKDPSDLQWNDDRDMKEYKAFLAKYLPKINVADTFAVTGYIIAQATAAVLKKCGDNLSRENVMQQAANIQDLQLSLLLPGIKVNTSATDFSPIKQLQLKRFKGEHWELFGDILHGGSGVR